MSPGVRWTSGCSAAWQRASFGTKRSWVQIPPPRQLSTRSEGPYRIGKGPLALLCFYLRDYRFLRAYGFLRSAARMPSMAVAPGPVATAVCIRAEQTRSRRSDCSVCPTVFVRTALGAVMRRATACGPVDIGVRTALALLVAVTALLCVFSHVQGPRGLAGSSSAPVSATSPLLEAPTGADAPCGKKAVAEQTAQRAESAPQLPDSFGWIASPTAVTPSPCNAGSALHGGGPAPPPPVSLHSVLRI